jgi:peptidoglycan/LPS O-acetylase OafA/YrhL
MLFKDLIKWIVFLPGPINDYPLSNQIVAGVVWTLKYEVLFYLSLPIFAFTLQNKKKPISFIISIMLCSVILILNKKFHFFRIWHLFQFVGGMLAAIVVGFEKNEYIKKTVNSKLISMLLISLLIFELFFFQDPYSIIPFILLSLFFVGIALGNNLFGILSYRSIRWLGEISYSTYITHGILLFVFMERIFAITNSYQYMMIMLPITISLIVLNTITYITIEVPGMSLGKIVSVRNRVTVSN